MCSTIESLVGLINADEQFHILQQAAESIDNKSDSIAQLKSLLSYFNSTHPSYIQVVEQNSSGYFNNLSESKNEKIVEQLYRQQTLFLIFSDKKEIPNIFLSQVKISIVLYQNKQRPTAYNYLLNAIYFIPIRTIAIHSCMIVIFGQGLLITGKSGSGKSNLLLALLERNHLWVADDAPRIYSNHLDHIIVEHPVHLSEYIHVKNVGAINVDQTFGKSKRIPHHRLAAIIHLSDNTENQQSSDSLLSGFTNRHILGIAIPEWQLPKEANNLVIMVETIAKQLNLNLWGNNASKMLSDSHNTHVSN